MPSVQLTTYADLISHALDYLGGDTTVQNERFARRAIQSAVSDYWSRRTWNYSYKRGRICTQQPYNTGTVAYLATSGAVPRQLTLTGGVWPTWAGDGQVQMSVGTQNTQLVPFPVAVRISDTVVQLQSALAPTFDVPSTTYTIAQESYPLPVDFGSAGEVVIMGFARVLIYQTPDSFVRQSRVYLGPAQPFMYTIQADTRRYGSLVASFYPAPDAFYNLDFSYQRQGRALSSHGSGVSPVVNVTAGKASISASSVTLTGTGTAFTPDMVGCVVRFAAQPASKIPTGQAGESPFYVQRTLVGWISATQMTMDQVPGVTLSGVPYSISDPVDIEPGAMSTYFLREVENHCRILRRMEPTKSEDRQYRQALVDAFEADSRNHENRSTFSSSFSTIRIATYPSGADRP